MDSVLQTMKFAQKLEMGFRLNSKKQNLAGPELPPVHPLFQPNQISIPCQKPEVKETEKNPFLSDYMSKFVDDIKKVSNFEEIKLRNKSPSKSPSRSSSKTKRTRSRSNSSSRSSSKSKSSHSASRSLRKSSHRSRSRSRSSRRSKSRDFSYRNRRSRSRSRHSSRSRSRSRHRSGSRSRLNKRRRSRSRDYRHRRSRSISPRNYSRKFDYRENRRRASIGYNYDRESFDRGNPVGRRISPPVRSKWENSPPIHTKKSRWDPNPDVRGHGAHSSRDFETSGKFTAGRKSDVMNEKEEKIGKTLNEMEAYVELAKRKKMAEMKMRNKEFLKQDYD